MTANEFKAWLEGYMLDRPNPDAHVIAKKAAEMQQTFTLPPMTQPGPHHPPTHVYGPSIGSAQPPFISPFTVTCSQTAETRAQLNN